jgi:hypothetical protein
MNKLNALKAFAATLALLIAAPLHAQTRTDGPSPALMRELSTTWNRAPLLALDTALTLQVPSLPAAPDTNAPVGQGGNAYSPGSLQQLESSIFGVAEAGMTNFFLVPYYTRFTSGVSGSAKNGMGVALAWELNTNGVVVYVGPRFQYAFGGAFIANGTVTLGVPTPITVFGHTFTMMPILYSGVSMPFSGSYIRGPNSTTLPPQFPIVGAGDLIRFFSAFNQHLTGGGGFEYEEWLTTGIKAVNVFLELHVSL